MLNYYAAARGDPLVLIHPLGRRAGRLGARAGAPGARARRDRRRPARLRRDSRRASATATLPTPQVLAGSVAALLDELGLGRAHVAGNSLGGWVALELAKAGRALSVAGLCTARALGAAAGAAARGATCAGLGRAPAPGHAHAAAQRARAALGAERLDRPPRAGAAGGGRRGWCASYLTSAGLRERQRGDALGRVLGLRGHPRSGHARLGRTSTGSCAAARRPLPEWRTITLHGCGHIPTWDDPSQVARMLLLAST